MNKEQKLIKNIISSVTTRSQVTVPAEVRRILGLKGKRKSKLVWSIEGNEIKIKPSKSSIRELYGSVKPLHPEIGWQEAEQIAKDEHAKHIIDEMNQS